MWYSALQLAHVTDSICLPFPLLPRRAFNREVSERGECVTVRNLLSGALLLAAKDYLRRPCFLLAALPLRMAEGVGFACMQV